CAHRNTVSIYSTNFSPFELFTGRKINMPIDSIVHFEPTEGTGEAQAYMRSLEERLQIIHKIATENMQESQQRYKKQYDKTATPCKYAVGKVLWMYSPSQLKAGSSKKMQIKYNRLVRIKEQLGDTSYKVVDHATGDELKYAVHVDNLREYIPDASHPIDPPSDAVTATKTQTPQKTVPRTIVNQSRTQVQKKPKKDSTVVSKQKTKPDSLTTANDKTNSRTVYLSQLKDL